LIVIDMRLLLSIQKRTEPSGFGTITTGLAHSPLAGSITCIERIRSTSFFPLSRATGPAFYGWCLTGTAPGFSRIRCSAFRIKPSFPSQWEECSWRRAFTAPNHLVGTDETSTFGGGEFFTLFDDVAISLSSFSDTS